MNWIENLKELPEMEWIPFLVGPTGVGKTEISIHLAKYLSIEIISADSRQTPLPISVPMVPVQLRCPL